MSHPARRLNTARVVIANITAKIACPIHMTHILRVNWAMGRQVSGVAAWSFINHTPSIKQSVPGGTRKQMAMAKRNFFALMSTSERQKATPTTGKLSPSTACGQPSPRCAIARTISPRGNRGRLTVAS